MKTLYMHNKDNYFKSTFRIDVSEDKYMVISFTNCSNKDQFCRKTGRDIVDSRINDGKYTFGGYFYDIIGVRSTVKLALSDAIHAMQSAKLKGVEIDEKRLGMLINAVYSF